MPIKSVASAPEKAARRRRRRGGPCACGCGRQCAQRRNQWATPACIPKVSRQAFGRSARAAYAVKARSAKFRGEVDRIVQMGRTIRHADLVALLMAVYERGYNSGLQTNLRREKQKGQAA